jgi:hypothetical protein
MARDWPSLAASPVDDLIALGASISADMDNLLARQDALYAAGNPRAAEIACAAITERAELTRAVCDAVRDKLGQAQ